MSGSTSFRFKKPVNWAYAPGLTKAGVDGSAGNRGTDGNAIYFIDYELNNSYNIELAQQKLENNYTLSGNSVQISEEREYHSGDLIISDSGSCYRIEKGADPYYTFSINYIGRISKASESMNDAKVTGVGILMLTDTEEYPRRYEGFVPNNRQYLREEDHKYCVDYSSDTEVDPEDLTIYEMNGIWYKFFVFVDGSVGANTDYTVEMRLNNEKTYAFDSVSNFEYEHASRFDPTTNLLYRVFNFGKTLEFSAPCITREEFLDTMTEQELIEYGDESNASPHFLSDMSMDKVHLFGNDIKELVCVQNGETYASVDGETRMERVESTDIMRRHAIPGRTFPESDSQEVLVPAAYSIFEATQSSDHEEGINWRGGESAYFSSCDPELAIKEMTCFIESHADFKIIIHDKNSGEIKTVIPDYIQYRYLLDDQR